MTTPRFAPSRPALVLVVLLLISMAAFYGRPRERRVDLAAPLGTLQPALSGWQLAGEGTVDPETQAVLRADQTLLRDYVNPATGERANLYIAFFRSQTAGIAPHSPKNCLPGSGWVASKAEILRIAVPGSAARIPVNRYIVSRGDDRALVLYWYQTHDRVVASEYRAKFFLVYDSIRLRRSDTSIVRVTVPITTGEAAATQAAESLMAAFYQPIRRLLPV